MATQMNGNFLLPYGEVWAFSLITLSVVLSVILPLSCLCVPYFPKTGSGSSNILREIFGIPITLHTT
jgi:hypothetical protein